MWQAADDRLADRLGIIESILGILIAGGILLQYFSTRYVAIVDRFRGLRGDYQGNNVGEVPRPGQDVAVVAIDGQRAALEAILRAERGVTVESTSRFGPLAFDTLERYLAGEGIPPRIRLLGRLFDTSNAGEILDDAY